MQLAERLANGETIILDGAIGTELERRGAPMDQGAWCATALETHPDLVRDVHRSYVEAGADVLTANTYATTRMALERAGRAQHMQAWNKLAMQMARDVAQHDSVERCVYVAGSVSTFGNFGEWSDEQLAQCFLEQGELLAQAGADLLLLETLAAKTSTIVTAINAIAHIGLPIWVAVSCVQDRQSGSMSLGIEESQSSSKFSMAHEDFGAAIDTIMCTGGSALLLMHSDLKATLPGLDVMRRHFTGTRGVYPNAGYWLRPEWSFVDQITPQTFLDEAVQWRQTGAQIIGGCCGIGPDHIRTLEALR